MAVRGPPTPWRLRLCSAKEDALRPDGRAPRSQFGGAGGGGDDTGDGVLLAPCPGEPVRDDQPR